MKRTIKDIDPEGVATLSVISKADRFNQWMYRTIAPYCQGRTLEIGSGIGTISQYFIRDGKDLVLSDLREQYCIVLREKFSHPVEMIDLVHPDFSNDYAHLIASFDTVFALNVVEHIEDDALAIANCARLLRPGGNLVILVPAFQALFNSFDVALEHFRRYTSRSLRNLVAANGFSVRKSFYFNLIAMAGWFFSGHVLRRKIIPEGQMGFFNRLVPLFKLADRVFLRKIGLSVIVVARKS